MDLYAIIRRNGWASPGDLQEAAARSTDVGDGEMSADVRWIRSYVLAGSGRLGTVCIYQALEPGGDRRACHPCGAPRRRGHSDGRHVLVRPDAEPVA